MSTRAVSRGEHSSTGTSPTALVQGAYFVVTGLFPLVHMKSFEAITGSKVDA